MSIKSSYRAKTTMQVAALLLFCFCLFKYTQITSARSPIDSAEGSRPNIVYILADDLGIGDIEPFGQQHIRTPNLNRMMREGMLLTQHYAGNTVCAPSRASLNGAQTVFPA